MLQFYLKVARTMRDQRMKEMTAYPFINVCIDGVVGHGEDVGVAVVAHHALIVNFQVGLSVEA